ncbi:MAG: PIN domain-containing protein [Nanoarchaeota archaeon]
MKFVVDTNILLSALLKNGLSREILTDFNFRFFTTSFALSEIAKYKEYVCKKSSLTEKQFDSTLKKIFEYVIIIPLDEYVSYTGRAKRLIKDSDDVPFLACAMALNSNIWSNDKHFKEQKKIKIFTTEEFIKRFMKKK